MDFIITPILTAISGILNDLPVIGSMVSNIFENLVKSLGFTIDSPGSSGSSGSSSSS